VSTALRRWPLAAVAGHPPRYDAAARRAVTL